VIPFAQRHEGCKRSWAGIIGLRSSPRRCTSKGGGRASTEEREIESDRDDGFHCMASLITCSDAAIFIGLDTTVHVHPAGGSSD
jgi:hypothetical protein